MTRRMQTFVFAATLVLMVLASVPAEAQSTMSVNGTAYFQANYRVGLSCSWSPVSGAVEYHVKHSRQDACGSATVIIETTSTSSGSGAHPNCDPNFCYSKTCEVYALNSSGTVLAQGSASICETGCASGNCPDCDYDGICEPGETVSSCYNDCGSSCVSGEPCIEDFECGSGICHQNQCKCI